MPVLSKGGSQAAHPHLPPRGAAGREPFPRQSSTTGEQAKGVGLDEHDASDIARALTGDHHAFAMLVGRHQTVAFRLAFVITGNAEDAEEATQEAFLRVYRNLPRFRRDAPFRPWLLQIVANAARTISRRSRRHQVASLADALFSPVDPPTENLPEAMAIRREEVRRMNQILRALSAADQQILVLRFVLDLSEAEIAASLDCRRGTVKSRLSRAAGRFRALAGAFDGVADS